MTNIFSNISLIDAIIIVICIFISATVATKLVPTVNSIAKIKGLLDYPGERTSHKKKTPRLGGISIFFATTVTALFFCNNNDFFQLKMFLLATTIIFFLGVRDDMVPVIPVTKLIAQIIAAAMIVYSGITINNFVGVFGVWQLNDTLASFISILFIILVINAVNLIDGVDGLCLAISFIILGFCTVAFLINNEYNWSVVCACYLGAIITVFIYNVFGRTNKTFIGDSGSLLLGTAISVVTIKLFDVLVTEQTTFLSNNVPALIFSLLLLPVSDFVRVFFVRLMINKSPFLPDKNHIHHKLIALGFSHLKTTVILSCFAVLCIILTLLLSKYFGTLILIAINSIVAASFYMMIYYFYGKTLKAHSDVNLS